MIPLYDTIPSRHRPTMTIILILVNTAVFLFETSLPGGVLGAFISAYGFIPARFAAGDYSGLLTSMFIHGGWLHLIGNMWALWLFGDNVEDRMGTGRFLLFYLTCGIVAALTHYFINPASAVPTVGASGAIAGVMGAYFVLYPRARVVTLIPVFIFPWMVDIPAFIYLGFWIISQVFSGTAALFAPEQATTVAFWAHVGGFVAGMLLHRIFFSARRNSPDRIF